MSTPAPPRAKIVAPDQLVSSLGRPRSEVVVFTNGCFDLLHAGHVEYLYEARRLGDALVVALNSDTSVRRLKGADRPLNPEDSRALVLAGLGCVDWVTLFEEDTPRALIAALLPDILVKGGDYRAEDVVGGPEVKAAGGRVVILPYRAGHSTSSLVSRIRRSDEPA